MNSNTVLCVSLFSFSSDRHITEKESTSSDRGPEETPSSLSARERWGQYPQAIPSSQSTPHGRASWQITHRNGCQSSWWRRGIFGWKFAIINHLQIGRQEKVLPLSSSLSAVMGASRKGKGVLLISPFNNQHWLWHWSQCCGRAFKLPTGRPPYFNTAWLMLIFNIFSTHSLRNLFTVHLSLLQL